MSWSQQEQRKFISQGKRDRDLLKLLVKKSEEQQRKEEEAKK